MEVGSVSTGLGAEMEGNWRKKASSPFSTGSEPITVAVVIDSTLSGSRKLLGLQPYRGL